MKIGLLGFGAIGREVLDYLQAAGAEVTVAGYRIPKQSARQ